MGAAAAGGAKVAAAVVAKAAEAQGPETGGAARRKASSGSPRRSTRSTRERKASGEYFRDFYPAADCDQPPHGGNRTVRNHLLQSAPRQRYAAGGLSHHHGNGRTAGSQSGH